MGRGMGEEDIEVAPITEAIKKEAGEDLKNPPIHLEISELVFSSVVAH